MPKVSPSTPTGNEAKVPGLLVSMPHCETVQAGRIDTAHLSQRPRMASRTS